MFKRCFWKDAIERAVSAGATSFASLMTLNVPFQALDWKQIASFSAVSAVYSIVTSISALGFGKENSASFLGKTPGEISYGKHSSKEE